MINPPPGSGPISIRRHTPATLNVQCLETTSLAATAQPCHLNTVETSIMRSLSALVLGYPEWLDSGEAEAVCNLPSNITGRRRSKLHNAPRDRIPPKIKQRRITGTRPTATPFGQVVTATSPCPLNGFVPSGLVLHQLRMRRGEPSLECGSDSAPTKTSPGTNVNPVNETTDLYLKTTKGLLPSLLNTLYSSRSQQRDFAASLRNVRSHQKQLPPTEGSSPRSVARSRTMRMNLRRIP